MTQWCEKAGRPLIMTSILEGTPSLRSVTGTGSEGSDFADGT